MLDQLRLAVESHVSHFLCHEIGNEINIRTVTVRHVSSPPISGQVVPDVSGVREFYATFEDLTLYFDEDSGDAAYAIVAPAGWPGLGEDFADTFAHLSDEELSEWLPVWCKDCLVVGTIPASGNYLLVATSGREAGKVFCFDHDGFEFIEIGSDLPNFVMRAMEPDSKTLTRMASHLRFSSCKPGEPQWWIVALNDNRGNSIHTQTE